MHGEMIHRFLFTSGQSLCQNPNPIRLEFSCWMQKLRNCPAGTFCLHTSAAVTSPRSAPRDGGSNAEMDHRAPFSTVSGLIFERL
jgi:hypothetical protein